MATRVIGSGKLTRITLPYAGSFAVNLYDAIVLNSATAKLASQLTDQLTEAKNQAAFGSQFVGLAMEAKLATDPAGTIVVGLSPVVEMTCVSETHAIGELVTFDEASSGTALEDAKLVKTTDRQAAVGVVVRNDTSASTTVMVALYNRAIHFDPIRVPFPVAAQQALSGAGAVDIESYYTAFTSTGATQALTLANGRYVGQLKKIKHVVDGGSGVLTPTSLSGGTTITFTAVAEECLLCWSGSAWVALELSNSAVPGTPPVLA